MMFNNKNTDMYYDEIISEYEYHDDITFKVFDDCSFNACNFEYAVFKHCKFKHCKFMNCKLSFIELNSTYFLNIDFVNCVIVGVNWASAEINLHQNLKFLNCDISKSSFLGLSLRSISITKCIAREADFRDCDLSKANLTECNFQNALFCNTNLIEADLINSINYYINVFDNKIKDAEFSLPEALSLLTSMGIKIV